MCVHFVVVDVCLTLSQNSYDIFQVLSLSILPFPRETSLLLAHYFADITLCDKMNFSSQHPLYQCIMISLTLLNFVAVSVVYRFSFYE